MALLVNVNSIRKSFGTAPLFSGLSLSIQEGDRLGVIGPNGSGKSTLLEVLAGQIEVDSGEVVARSGTRVAYVRQDSQFPADLTVRGVIEAALDRAHVPEGDRDGLLFETLGRAGFEDFDARANALSGGWRKRLSIAEALVQSPSILLLDEPTNHLDLAGIQWLEALLTRSAFTCVVVSHDRYFLENVPTSVAEINRVYPGGVLHVQGPYSSFLEKKAEFLAAQAKHQDALENRVRTELEWLRRGPKARATKAKARIDTAHEMINELADLRQRSRTATAGIDFTATGRKTKRLVHLDGVSYGFDNRVLFRDLDFAITAGVRVGLVGPNGSGKTTLQRLLSGEIEPQQGEIRRAEGLRVVTFNQIRQLDPNLTLRRTLAPDSDSVVYRDRVIHVASWASRFLFAAEQLEQPVGKLSGGERARVLIANLLLEPADVLLLDEPTNDLDIPTLEILEESLLEFPGALVLVTHDRYLLDRVSTVVLGLDGQGRTETFADYSQWDQWQAQQSQPRAKAAPAPVRESSPTPRRLSYLENREYESIEARIHDAERELEAKRNTLQDPEVVTDGRRLQLTYSEMEEAQKLVDQLYARWAELEEKRG